MMTRYIDILDEESMDPLDRKAYEIILKNSNNGGIIQSRLWKMLGVDSREGSKIVLRLIKRGLITRKRISYEGKQTYMLNAITNNNKNINIYVSLENMWKIPCFTCDLLYSCGKSSAINPINCNKLNKFLSIENANIIKSYSMI
jgi:hypothetical protein